MLSDVPGNLASKSDPVRILQLHRFDFSLLINFLIIEFYLRAVGQKAVCVEVLSVSWDIKMEGSLVFKVLGGVSKANLRTSAVGLRKEYFLGILAGSHERLPRRTQGPRRAGWSSRTTSSKHRSNSFQRARQKASTEETNVSD